ncbi:CehA/McbA family metallohydrolase [Krasilnikovia sp. M28-CT-15]|uniref:CehA/McbA family metallohydrolase n=1 Tax=Krasilnikovia sp. M28-CT-15 TaxID=3373540 RepID=UPI0038773D11
MSTDRETPRPTAPRRQVLRLGAAITVGALLPAVPARTARADRGSPGGRLTTTRYAGHSPAGFDQWAYVPFEVPPGVSRISVSRWFHPFVLVPGLLENVLDIGLFGAAGWGPGAEAGFRGWSGGARDSFTVAAADATPGYLAGPLDPGTWAVALGPIVYDPRGMDWTVDVTLESGPAGPAFRPSPAPARATGRGPAWYRGDMHLHTVHSDGQRTPERLAADARARGLDFFASTEHNTRAANQIWGQYATDDLLIIGGEEVTTRHGHWLALGLPVDRWVDWRYAPDQALFAQYADAVRAGGGVVVAAHPLTPGPGALWEFGYDHVDGLEVWSGPWTVDDATAVRVWDGLLRQGRRVAAVGNSDAHGPGDVVGLPHTVVYAPELSRPAILAAVRSGRSYLAESAEVTLDLRAVAAGRVAGPGQTLAVGAGTVEVTAVVSGVPGATVTLHTRHGQVAAGLIGGSGTGTLTWHGRGARAGFVRVEVRRPQPTSTTLTTMAALSNPVWLE